MKGVEMGTGQSAYDIVHSGTHALKYAGKAKGMWNAGGATSSRKTVSYSSVVTNHSPCWCRRRRGEEAGARGMMGNAGSGQRR